MCMFKVSYLGKTKKQGSALKFGNLYGVQKIISGEKGKYFFILEGIEGKYEEKDFHRLESKGFHYLNGSSIPQIGTCMRLVKRKNDMNEFMTGEIKEVEKTALDNVYRVYTEKCIYDVSPIL